MDPDVALETLRNHFNNFHQQGTLIADSFNGLDKWLSSGGFLPAAWEKHRKATL